jgi:hypothetical protein
MRNTKTKISFPFFFALFLGCNFLSAKTESKKNKEQTEEVKEGSHKESHKEEVETEEGGVSYYEKTKRKPKEPHKNTKAHGPMDPSNRQGEGLQNTNGSRE